MKKNVLKLIIPVIVIVMAAAFVISSCMNSGKNAYDYHGEERPAGSGTAFSDDAASATLPKGNESSENKEDYSSKLIKEIDISGETKQFDEAKANVYDLIEKTGGYVESSEMGAARYNGASRGRSLSMTIRIPSEKLDEFSSAVGENINIYSSKERISDVTSSYYDMKARMDTLITKRDALTEMLKEAKDLNEVLTIQDRLYETIAEIEAYETALRGIDSKVTYSTVRLTLDEVKEYTPIPEDSFLKRFSDSFMEGWTSFVSGMQEFAIWFVGALPVLLFIGVIFLVIFLIIFGSIKAGRKRRARAAAAAKASRQSTAASAPAEQTPPQNNIYGNNI
ncbi:MAG: DUF4349 domain-containing protein [Clostridia bacterium]|nr:DUF4349 domain-containing protein [Clostridia bacterium]